MNEVRRDPPPALCVLRGVHQYDGRDHRRYSVLADIELTLRTGDTCAVVGASGTGKSTLLNILGLLERPGAGHYQFAGYDLASASPEQRSPIPAASLKTHGGECCCPPWRALHPLSSTPHESGVRLCGYYPALSASRLSPAIALRDD